MNDLTMEQVELRIYQAEKLEAERVSALAAKTGEAVLIALMKIKS